MQCFSENCGCNSVLGAGNNLAPSVSFKPRGMVARSLYQKQMHDEFLSQFDKQEVGWNF